MSTQKESNIRASYIELNRFGQNGEYEKALKSANKILQNAPDEEKAFQCKIVCLIHMSKFNDALQFIVRQPKLACGLVFEKAYTEYRLNKTIDALKTVDTAPSVTQELKELRAQILYKLEKYDECFDAYRDIIKNTNDDYEDERATNLSAVIANMCNESTDREIPELQEHTYELCYNSACALAGKKKYVEAANKLNVSESLCRESLAEEAETTEEDIQDELAIVKVQLAYCLQMQGREKEAAIIYADALKHKPDDVALVAVASNNIVAINKDQNMFESKKKIKAAMADAVEHKLTSRQKKCIALNNCLLALFTNQSEQCQQFCTRLVEKYPDTEYEAVLIKATQLSKDNKVKDASVMLKKYASSHPEKHLDIHFASVQLLLSQGERKEAIKVLQELGEARYRPGVVSALVSLLLGDGQNDAASQVLKDAVEWYKKSKVSAGDLSSMWRQAADFHLRGGEPKTAASSLEELLKTNPKDVKTLAQLVIAYAQFDPDKAQKVSKQLPALGVEGTDVEALENSSWVLGSKGKKAGKIEQSPGTPGAELLQQAKKKNRKRKGKFPKNYDASQAPDPERWLPKHERTGFRKKRDRRMKDIIKGSQGMATGAADMYDMSKVQNQQVKGSPAPVISPEVAGPRQQQRKIQQKKKKKGGKWSNNI